MIKTITKDRDYSIDVARGIACLLVVIGHINSVPSAIRMWIYSFHMPLFFIISGLFINTNEPFKCYLGKKIKGLLVPYYLLNLCVFFVESGAKIVLRIITHRPLLLEEFFDFFIGIFLGYRLTKYFYTLWFISALFFASLFAYLILKYVKNKHIVFIIGVLLILLNVLLWQSINGYYYSLDLVPISTGFLLIGDSFIKVLTKWSIANNVVFILCLLSIQIAFSIFSANKWGMVDLYFCHIGKILPFLFNSIVGAFSIIMIAKKINRSVFFEFLSSSALAFYGFQNRLVIPASNWISGHLFKIISIVFFQSLEWVFTVLLAIIGLSIISLLIDKYTPWIVGKKAR